MIGYSVGGQATGMLEGGLEAFELVAAGVHLGLLST